MIGNEILLFDILQVQDFKQIIPDDWTGGEVGVEISTEITRRLSKTKTDFSTREEQFGSQIRRLSLQARIVSSDSNDKIELIRVEPPGEEKIMS